MRRSLAALLSLASWASCAEPAPPAATSLPIINGTFDTGDPAVVGLSNGMGDPFCSGTVVSRYVVVSAGHCTAFGIPRYAYLGSDPAAGGTFLDVMTIVPHPDFDLSTLANDISVVILAEPAPVTPVPLATRPPVAGQVARFVGFGYTEVGPAGEYGRKYQTTAPITSVERTTFGYGVATCNGDSGGPALLAGREGEVLAGLTSSGDGPCAEYGTDTRVDVYAAWVQGYIDQYDAATCGADGTCAPGCEDTPDPDCPCAPDGMCTAACPDPADDPDCPPECAGEGSCVIDCPVRDPDCPVIPLGEDCVTDFDCGPAYCYGVCVAPCDPADPAACAAGGTCQDIGGRAACVDDCPGGWCAAAPGRARGAFTLIALVIVFFRGRRAR